MRWKNYSSAVGWLTEGERVFNQAALVADADDEIKRAVVTAYQETSSGKLEIAKDLKRLVKSLQSLDDNLNVFEAGGKIIIVSRRDRENIRIILPQ